MRLTIQTTHLRLARVRDIRRTGMGTEFRPWDK